MVNKDKTGGERQSRLRQMRKQFIKSYGFNSAEGIVGALVRGEKLLIDVKQFVEIIEDLDSLEFCCFCEENHTRHDLFCPVFLLTKMIPVASVPTQRAGDTATPTQTGKRGIKK